jgi:hypothetical protein
MKQWSVIALISSDYMASSTSFLDYFLTENLKITIAIDSHIFNPDKFLFHVFKFNY